MRFINRIMIYLVKKISFLFSDQIYLQILYFLIFRNRLNLNNVKTFNEKLQWLKIYDRNNKYTLMVDKYLVKKYVSNIINEKHIIPTLGIYNSFNEIDFDKLPNEFVIKCTHDSGGVVICNNKEIFDKKKANNKIKKCLKKNFYYASREWPYKNVVPRIIIEKYMGCNINDYKIFCFNGKPKFTLVCSNREGKKKNTDFYDNDWNLLPFTREKHTNNIYGIKKPKNFERMLEIARLLSKDIPFVRVDLYEINSKIYFGELTFYPSGGFEGFNPKEWDKIIGDMLVLPKVECYENNYRC